MCLIKDHDIALAIQYRSQDAKHSAGIDQKAMPGDADTAVAIEAHWETEPSGLRSAKLQLESTTTAPTHE